MLYIVSGITSYISFVEYLIIKYSRQLCNLTLLLLYQLYATKRQIKRHINIIFEDCISSTMIWAATIYTTRRTMETLILWFYFENEIKKSVGHNGTFCSYVHVSNRKITNTFQKSTKNMQWFAFFIIFLSIYRSESTQILQIFRLI